MKTEGNRRILVGGYFPRFRVKGQYKGNAIEYSDPRKKEALRGRQLKRTLALPTSATRRARPQNPSSFRLVQMASGELITVASHVEPENYKREQPDMYSTRYTDIKHLPATMMLTANDRTERTTGPSIASVNYSGAAQEPWQVGNTRRFGNKGSPWVGNSKASCGGAPGISEEQVSKWSIGSSRGPSFSATSFAADAFTGRSQGQSTALPSIRGGSLRS